MSNTDDQDESTESAEAAADRLSLMLEVGRILERERQRRQQPPWTWRYLETTELLFWHFGIWFWLMLGGVAVLISDQHIWLRVALILQPIFLWGIRLNTISNRQHLETRSQFPLPECQRTQEPWTTRRVRKEAELMAYVVLTIWMMLDPPEIITRIDAWLDGDGTQWLRATLICVPPLIFSVRDRGLSDRQRRRRHQQEQYRNLAARRLE